MPATALLVSVILIATSPIGLPPAGQWPVDEPVVVSGFRPAEPDWTEGHRGVDLHARTGTPVRSITAGRIAYVGQIAGKPVVTVALPGPATLRTTYEPVVASVPVGQRVRAGQVIGVVAARGGHCGGDAGCVHVGLRSPDGYLDPLRLIMRLPAVLKPRRSLGTGPRMGERERRAQPLDRDMRVPLGRRHGGVPE
jgi:murein DD-endopeptidase MepM/ murein hydrolase activator NlpD